jgi:hypothetical protein
LLGEAGGEVIDTVPADVLAGEDAGAAGCTYRGGDKGMGLPMQDIVSQRWSSVNRKMMFGGFAVVVLAVRSSPRQPVIGIAAVAAVPATSFTNWRRLRFSLFG